MNLEVILVRTASAVKTEERSFANWSTST